MIVTPINAVERGNGTLEQRRADRTDNLAYACEPGKPYFVYEISERKGGEGLIYGINIQGGITFNDIPARYFTVLDSTIPSDWEEDTYDVYGNEVHVQSFPEMAHDKFFYDRLMNDDPKTVEVFWSYAQKYEKAARDFE